MDIHYGDWNVVRKIGSGSFGTVYEIERKTFEFSQKAALKVISIPQSQGEISSIRNTGMDEASIGEYYRDLASEIVKELIILEQLKGHTNIVSYEDHEIRAKEGEIGWDIFIRMELLTPLNQYLSCHEMGRNEVIQLGIDLCRALERCESLNIIHRDIKPDNIFLSSQGDGKLGDFGIARTVERTTSQMSKKGAYSFMAPEVYLGKPYGETVDIYSLGLVLYRLLNYNRGPFIPPYPQPIKFQNQEQALIRRVSGEKLPQPALADQNLAEIVLKACSFEPEERYDSAEEMRRALQGAVSMKSVDSPALTDSRCFEISNKKAAEANNDDATICGPGVFPADPEQDDKLIFSLNDRTGAGHQTDVENQSNSLEEQLCEDRTVSGFHPEIEEPGSAVNNQAVDDRTVSVFHTADELRVSAATDNSGVDLSHPKIISDDDTVSLFSYSSNNTLAHPSETDGQKSVPTSQSSKLDYCFKEKRDSYVKEEEERKQKEKKKEEEKKKKNKKILIIVAVLLTGIGLICASISSITAATVEVPDLVWEYYDIACSKLMELELEPRVEFTDYVEGETRFVVEMEPGASTKLHKGDTVTLIVNGWARDDIDIRTNKKILDMKVGETQKLTITFSGNLPDECWPSCFYKNGIGVEWGDWIEDGICEMFVTAREQVSHAMILITVYPDEEGEGDPLSAVMVEVNA